MNDDGGRKAMNHYFEGDWKSQLSSLGIDSGGYSYAPGTKNDVLKDMYREKVMEQAWNKWLNKMNKPK